MTMYPDVRLRRLRTSSWIRDLLAETVLLPKDLVQPFFVIEGNNKKEPVLTMPGIDRLSIDLLVEKVKEAVRLGIKLIALFPSVDESLKDELGTEAYNENNLISRAVRAIKAAKIEIGVACDIALDPYTTHRHDGIVKNGDVDNDLSIEALEKQALVLAKAGADIVAPSDMMDGRVGAIRKMLDRESYNNVAILSYAMKYNTNLYGPFRDAVRSITASSKYLSKATYQADYRVGYKQAIREAELDIAEGADMIMVKPAMFYIDIINNIANMTNVPVFAYQVSGEYAMLKLAADNNLLNWENTMIESLLAIKRAGSTGIFTYAAMDIAKFLRNSNLVF